MKRGWDSRLGQGLRFVYWQDGDAWLGYLEEYPDYMTQGVSLDALEENLKDLVEELTSGRDRGAGIRVVVGDTTGFAHTADLSETGLHAAARAALSAQRDSPIEALSTLHPACMLPCRSSRTAPTRNPE